MHHIRINEIAYLRDIALSDAPEIFRVIDAQRDYLGQWLPFVCHTKTIEDSTAFVHSIISAPQEDRELVFAIIVDESFAGIIGFKDTDKANKKTKIGYWLAKDYQGQGIMTHAVHALSTFAFNVLNINRIQIKCAVGNTRSSNIPRRLGFIFEGIERDGELQSDGRFSDIEIFSMLSGEYLNQ